MYNRLINFRRKDAYKVRQSGNQMSNFRPQPDHLSNGEEEFYRNPRGRLSYIANFSKGLKHNIFGEVIPDAYRHMVRPMYSTDPILFERTGMMGGINELNLINPQSGLAFDLEGVDPQAVTMPPAPRMDSAEGSGEMGELYWMSVCRDVLFSDYNTAANSDVSLALSTTGSLTRDAVRSLNDPAEFSVFRTTVGGTVTFQNLFRGFTPGDLTGPYISQFLLKPIPYGALRVEQLVPLAIPGQNYLTNFNFWLRAQNGYWDSDANGFYDMSENMIFPPPPPPTPPCAFPPPASPCGTPSLFQASRRHICNLRDLATYVHYDALYEAYLNACLILLGMQARVDPGNPYIDMPGFRTQRTQDGFGTFGPPHILTWVTEIATRALKAVWFQKWGVHRRFRPEEFGGRIHVNRHGLPALGLLPGRFNGMINNEILNSLNGGGLSAYFPLAGGTSLLPQAFKEGAPAHPSYASGHATVAGACVTVLKAWFDESEVFDPNVVRKHQSHIPDCVLDDMRIMRQAVTTDSNCCLIRYKGPILRVGDELNKLAGNISQARNAAGVHYRSDYTQGLLLGEEIAIRFLQEQRLTYNEDYHLSLTKFDGKSIVV